MLTFLNDLLLGQDIHPNTVLYLVASIKIVLILLFCILANFIAKRILLNTLRTIILKTKNTWDNILLEKHVFDSLSHLAPAFVVFFLVPLYFPEHDVLLNLAARFTLVYMLSVLLFVINAVLNAVYEILQRMKRFQNRPVRGYVQACKIVVFFLGSVLVIATLLERSPWGLLSLLGGLTAVLLLVFKDTILGFVAGILISVNKMVSIGDWIEMPKYGADGDVIDISINTVKVRNWDKTITTIPTYSLISDSFKNWRAMSESGGRRIKRALYIDINSIRFCDEEMLTKFSKIDALKDYLTDKEREIEEYHKKYPFTPDSGVNGRRLTNIGTFRAYIVQYLKRHPQVHQNMTFLVRHLAPTPQGLPIEIYVFSRDAVWANYEAIQSDIFDHILAVVPEFGLRVFQQPSGHDIRCFRAADKVNNGSQ